MAYFSIKDFVSNAAVKIKSLVVNTDENIPVHAILDSSGAEVIGTKTDAKNASTDNTAVSLMSVFKQISASVQAIVTAVTGVSTAANQTAANTKLDTLHTDLTSLATSQATLHTDLNTTLHADLGTLHADLGGVATQTTLAALLAALTSVISSSKVNVELDPAQVGTPGQTTQATATTVTPPSDVPFSVVDGGSGLTTAWGVAGVPVSNADMTAGTMVTDVPTAGQKIVIDDILLSVGSTAMSVTLKEETSGTVLFGPWYCPANSGPMQITLRGKKKLATANKRVQCFASAAGNINVQIGYHSEA